MSRDLLERAQEHCFMAGVGDSGAALCEANVPYGLAKIHSVQEQLGHPPDAIFVGAPDATVTRNANRWNQGFGYGGSYQWSGEFTVLDIKPNACGMIAGALPALPELTAVRERLRGIERDGLVMDGVTLDNDLTESNHFVDVFTVNKTNSTEAAPLGAEYFFIMHSSGHEHRGATERGPGLYYDESDELMSLARHMQTPFGRLLILEGDEVARFQEFYLRVQDFNHRRREVLARALFDELEVVVNATHQGLVRGYNKANIGCYTFDDDEAEAQPLFPLTLSPTLPAYFVRGARNVSAATIDRLGWRERAERHRVIDRLAGTNLLPHGGGYTYDFVKGVARVQEDAPEARRFVLDTDDGEVAIRTPRDLSYSYRGMEVKHRMEELELGRAVVELELNYVLK